jgi:hypothetical protein
VSFEEAVRLGKKLDLSAVFEASAKNNNCIDNIFYRSIVNCVDFNNAGVEQSIFVSGRNSNRPRSRLCSA